MALGLFTLYVVGYFSKSRLEVHGSVNRTNVFSLSQARERVLNREYIFVAAILRGF